MRKVVSNAVAGTGLAIALPLALIFQVLGFVLLGFVFGWFPMIVFDIVQSRTGLPVGLDYVSSSLVLSLLSFAGLLGSRVNNGRKIGVR